MPSSEAVIEICLCEEPVNYISAGPLSPGVGAECVFLGRTRADEHPKHGKLLQLGYEAYKPLAEQILRELAQAAAAEYGCRFVRVHHAICDVPIGEASVLVQVACPRRAEAFAACRFLIDELKNLAPIWKRQQWATGTTWAEGKAVPTPEGRA